MEASLELEDDVFFADLSKQISLLIMDDDDDDESLVRCPSVVNLQDFTQAMNPETTRATFVNYDHQTCKREFSKGTGVFIPTRSTNPRRKNVKQGRFSGNKLQRPSSDHNSRAVVPHFKYNNINYNINPSYNDSFNPRRF